MGICGILSLLYYINIVVESIHFYIVYGKSIHGIKKKSETPDHRLAM
jgi:hypothetical protein